MRKLQFSRIDVVFSLAAILLASCLGHVSLAETDATTTTRRCEIQLRDFPGLPIQSQLMKGHFDSDYLHGQLSKTIPELKEMGEPAIVLDVLSGRDQGIVYLSTTNRELSDRLLSEAAKIIVDHLNSIFKDSVRLLSNSLAAKEKAARGVEEKLNEVTSPLGVEDLEAESQRLRDSVSLLRQDVFKLELRETEIAAREEFLTRQLQPSLTANEVWRRIKREPKRLHVPPAEQEGTAKPILLFITPRIIWPGGTDISGPRPTQIEVEARFVEVLALDSLINPRGQKWEWPIRGIFNDEEFQLLWRDLHQKDWTDLLSAPRLTTISGQQAQIEVVNEVTYPIEFDIEEGLERAKPTKRERRDVGIILNVTPTASEDGNVISLDFWAEVCDLVRWQNYGTEKCPINQPVFETRRCSANVRLADRQTLLISSNIKPRREGDGPGSGIATEKLQPDMTGEIIRLEAEMAGVRSSLKKLRLEIEKCHRRREIAMDLLPEYEELRQELDLRKEWVAEARRKLIEAKDALVTSQPKVIHHPLREGTGSS